MLETQLIQHFATGGTIDSIWFPEQDTAKNTTYSVASKYFEWLEAKGFVHIDSQTLDLKDSREISLSDRKKYADIIVESSHNRIIVTVGTYLMPELAKTIHKHYSLQHHLNRDKHVVVTGSLIPMEDFMMSDGGFNLGMSCALLTTFKGKLPSISAVINGQALPADDLEKDLTNATFAKSEDDFLGYDDYTLIAAGGSISFTPNDMDILIPMKESDIPNYIRNKVRTVKNPSFTPPLLKDSRDLNETDIRNIINMINNTVHKHIIVTCGLIRIKELRDAIEAGLDDSSTDKQIVMTGSRLPLKMAGYTDATFNLGFAHGVLGALNPGVHIALAGRVYGQGDDPLIHTYSKKELEILTKKS